MRGQTDLGAPEGFQHRQKRCCPSAVDQVREVPVGTFCGVSLGNAWHSERIFQVLGRKQERHKVRETPEHTDSRRETLFRVITNVFLKQFALKKKKKPFHFKKFYRHIYLILKTPFVLKKNAHFIF